jgi:uridine phosphorylase
LKVVLGEKIYLPTILDQDLAKELQSLGAPEDGFDLVVAKTMCASDFYEGQGRLDGAFCRHSITDKMAYLRKLQEAGIVNIEMECTAFAALAHQARIKAGICCVAMLDRLEGDQVGPSLRPRFFLISDIISELTRRLTLFKAF